MAAYLSPIFGAGAQLFDDQGRVLNGGKIFTYKAGTTTAQSTWTESTQITQNANPIILSAAGRPAAEIWLQAGVAYKFVVTDSAGASVGPTYDNISGVNDASSSGSSSSNLWIPTGLTPTYISANSFSVPGNKTTLFTPGVMIQTVNSGGTLYAKVYNSVFGSVTTVNIINVGASIDSGLSAVSVSAITTATGYTASESALHDGPFWEATGLVTTYVSGTSFTVPGDYTTTFRQGSRLKTVNTGGTYYHTVKSSSYAASVTTVNLDNTGSTAIDSGIRCVLISKSNVNLLTPISTYGISGNYTPWFLGYDSAYNTSATPTEATTYTEKIDISGNFDPTTGRFTAPVAGIYLLTATIWTVGAILISGTGDIRKNGTTGYWGSTYVSNQEGEAADTNALRTMTIVLLLDMAVSDYASVYTSSDGSINMKAKSFQGILLSTLG